MRSSRKATDFTLEEIVSLNWCAQQTQNIISVPFRSNSTTTHSTMPHTTKKSQNSRNKSLIGHEAQHAAKRDKGLGTQVFEQQKQQGRVMKAKAASAASDQQKEQGKGNK
mmetsp:Transcript_6464/g.24304  ORF Transcript_6464/g.24304 Transcript_6464/m.24304 type:complete len:110 (+) Transcript_6464:2589-2918(+)